MKKILINASNLHNGGGVQVAASFIMELSRRTAAQEGYEFSVFASSLVDSNLRSLGLNKEAFKDYRVLNVRGIQAVKLRVVKDFGCFDLVFTVFGPFYGLEKLKNHIVGFAQPWIIYPNNEISESYSVANRVSTKLKFWVQWLFFKRANRLVVELQHVQERLALLKSFPRERIDVVSNCVSSVYFDPEKWMPIERLSRRSSEEILLGFVTRDYPHKNVGILLEVMKQFEILSKNRYKFVVTLSDSEWDARSAEFKENILNVGPISVAQCPEFYRAVDGVVFPSLLECFSATPLEAMVMKKPLFASDRGFVRDCCGNNAIYFDPLSAKSIAISIDEWFSATSMETRASRVSAAYQHVISMPDSGARAERYLEIMKKQLVGT